MGIEGKEKRERRKRKARQEKRSGVSLYRKYLDKPVVK